MDNLKTTPTMVAMFLDELENRFVVAQRQLLQCD